MSATLKLAVLAVALCAAAHVSSATRLRSGVMSESMTTTESVMKLRTALGCAEPLMMDLGEKEDSKEAIAYDTKKAIDDQVGNTKYSVTPAAGIVELSLEQLTNALQTRPIVALFYANWSTANKNAQQLLNRMSSQLANCQKTGILMGRFDTEVPGNQQFAKSLGIDAVPSFVFFPVATRQAVIFPGTPSDKQFVEWLAEAAAQSEKAAENAKKRARASQPTGEGGTDGSETGALTGILGVHNVYRARHHITPLSWNNDIALYAQSWADGLRINGCKAEKRIGSEKKQPYGENVSIVKGKLGTASTVVEGWYNQGVDKYSYTDGSCKGGKSICDDFTQIVWASSQQVGCGMAVCDNHDEVWVCNYSPEGNQSGSYVNNVKDPAAVVQPKGE